MNLVGHNYVAYKVLNRYNSDIAFGSQVPDLVPFVPNSTFSFEEIHENPDVLLYFLENVSPQNIDVALAMMTHSVKFGADEFNKEIDNWLVNGDEKLLSQLAIKILDCSSIPLETAKGPRMHNYLWCGVDVHILNQYPKFMIQLAENYQNIDLTKYSSLLSLCFNKEEHRVLKDLRYLFEPVQEIGLNSLTTLEGLVSYWKIFLAGLPDGDSVNIKKTKVVFEEIYGTFENSWEDVLEKVIADVKSRIHPYLTNSKSSNNDN